MLRAGIRTTVALLAAASLLPVAAASAAPMPKPHLSQVLAEPPATGYEELASNVPGVLEGPFSAGDYGAIAGVYAYSTIRTLEKDGFVGGYGRAWVQQSPRRLLVEIVVAFTGGTGARNWLQQSEQADLADPTFQHTISVDGIDVYYGARMSDSASYFADNFVFVKGNDGFLASTMSSADDLGDSAATQAKVQYRHAPEYTIPPEGWPGTRPAFFSLARIAALAPFVTAGLAAAGALWWLGMVTAARRRRRRGYDPSGL